jgi:hypothetical protein
VQATADAEVTAPVADLEVDATVTADRSQVQATADAKLSIPGTNVEIDLDLGLGSPATTSESTRGSGETP